MPTKFASRTTKQLKEHAALFPNKAAYTKFHGVMFSAVKFERRTQVYVNGMPSSFAEVEELLCKLYREVYGNKASEDVISPKINYHDHKPTTRGAVDYAKANPPKPTLTTVQAFKSAPPGSYVVAGEAAGYMSRCMMMQTMNHADRKKLKISQDRHRGHVVSLAASYSQSMLDGIHSITKGHNAEVRISGGKCTMVAPPKKPSVVKHLKKLCKYYERTYGVKHLWEHINNIAGVPRA